MAKNKVRANQNRKNTNSSAKRKNTQKQSSNGDKKKLSPEVQEQLDLFIINGMNIIYEEDMAKSIMKKVSNSQDPIKAIAEISVEIITRLRESAGEHGRSLEKDVLVQGGNVLVGEIIRLLEEGGMTKLSEKQRMACWQLVVSMYIDRAVQTGEMSKQELVHRAQMAAQTDEGKKILETAKDPELNKKEELPNE